MQSKTKKIAILGLGLMGGSLALSLKSSGHEVIGITRKKETIDSALKVGAIDKGFTEISSEALLGADVLFIATPLSQIIADIKRIKAILSDEIIISDLGSTKSEICNFAKGNLPENITFVGGHPMAGTEKSGFDFARGDLFVNCAWVLTPLDESSRSKEAMGVLVKIVKNVGAVPVISSCEKHDQAVALISHLPLLVSAGLCQVAKAMDDKEIASLALLLASSGFRDMTRIGGGNPQLNFDLILSNHVQLNSLLPEFYKELENMLRMAKENPEVLKKSLSEINKWRAELYDKNGKNSFLLKEKLKIKS